MDVGLLGLLSNEECVYQASRPINLVSCKGLHTRQFDSLVEIIFKFSFLLTYVKHG